MRHGHFFAATPYTKNVFKALFRVNLLLLGAVEAAKNTKLTTGKQGKTSETRKREEIQTEEMN